MKFAKSAYRLRLASTLVILFGAVVFVRAEPVPVVIWLGGDVHLGSRKADLLAPLRPLLDGAGIVNLEGPIATSARGKGLRLHNDPDGVALLARSGIRVLSVENNHSGDAGADGKTRTKEAAARLGLLTAGDTLLTISGVKLAISSFDLTHGVPPDLTARITAQKADHQVVTFHTTGPASYLPPKVLKDAVELALSSGAHVVAAHGSHMVGPVERRGNSVIAWGLGNLLFDCDCTTERDGLILRVTLDATRILSAEVIPVDAGLKGQPATPAHDPNLVFDLLESIGSRGLTRNRDRASL